MKTKKDKNKTLKNGYKKTPMAIITVTHSPPSLKLIV